MPNFPLENSKNKGRKSWRVSPYFFVLATIFSATFALLFLSYFRAWKSDISVLIIPKNESASFQADQIMENLTDITHRLSFYDRVLFDDREIKDPFAGQSKDERKENWNKSFAIERLPESTTLNISVFNADKLEANKIARQMALSLSEVASRFYNIRTELEFRIIEGPISSTFIRNWPWLAVSSILAGSLLAYLFLVFLGLFSAKIKNKVVKNIARRDYFSPSIGRAEESYVPKSIVRHEAVKKASAPSNLPIAEEEAEGPAEIFASLDEESLAKKGEPTDEEYRERLNKLLRGEL